MQNYMKTILSAFKTWVESKIKDNQRQADEKIEKVNKNIDNNVVELSKRIDNSAADWSQNDASADNYVKNRTHWEETGKEIVILPEATIMGFTLVQEPLYAVQNAFYFEPELNKTYTVTWDGIGYDVELKEFDGLACLGNENYVDMNGGGNIPFALIFDDDIFVVTESTKASHTISITTSETIVHKIDEKYLPKIASTPDWNQNDPEGEGYIKNRIAYSNSKTYKDDYDGIVAGYYCYHVSDDILTYEYITAAPSLSIIQNGRTYTNLRVVNDENAIMIYNADQYSTVPTYVWGYLVIIVKNPNVTILETNFNDTGVYLYNDSEYGDRVSSFTIYGDIKTLPEEVLPVDVLQSDWNETSETSLAYIKNKPDVALQSDTQSLQNSINRIKETKDFIVLKDTSDECLYKIQIKNGNIISSIAGSLEDFTYYTNSDGTYTINGWNQTYCGKSSTEMIVPDGSDITI